MGNACPFISFQKTCKDPHSQEGSVETIQVLRNNQRLVSRYGCANSPRDHAQYKCHEVDNKADHVQYIPTITKG